MPTDYQSGDAIITIDPINLRFHMNIESEELREATQRWAMCGDFQLDSARPSSRAAATWLRSTPS